MIEKLASKQSYGTRDLSRATLVHPVYYNIVIIIVNDYIVIIITVQYIRTFCLLFNY